MKNENTKKKRPTRLGKELLQLLQNYLKDKKDGVSDCTTTDLATIMQRSQRSIAGIVTQLQHISLVYVKRTSINGEKMTFVYLTKQGREYSP